MEAYSIKFDGRVLNRGFWLYVIDILAPDGRRLYVGRTGDSSSANAASPFARIGQHLDCRANAKGNALARNLRAVGISPSACSMEMIAIGPIFPEEHVFALHKPVRDEMASLERALALALRQRGFIVLGKHSASREPEAAKLTEVLRLVERKLARKGKPLSCAGANGAGDEAKAPRLNARSSGPSGGTMSCHPLITARTPGGAKSLAVLIRSYTMHDRPRSRDELGYFAGLPSLDRVIEAAAVATDARGKRLDHQRRLTRAALVRAKGNLLAALPELRKCQSFEELHTLTDRLVRGIRGLGELYVYDTSLRIGVHLNLWPEKVYLHAGTRKGARALGFWGAVSCVDRLEMPVNVQELAPHEIEDFLCIYKAQLAQLRGLTTRSTRRPKKPRAG